VMDDDVQDERTNEILGDDEEQDFELCREQYYQHLSRSLLLPCDVTGCEDFRWEEFYVLGPGDPKEHERLREDCPSFEDSFELLSIETGVRSEWMMFDGDIACRVRRKSDGKAFCLGLSELEVVDRTSRNYQLVDDYAVWFVNSRK